MCQILMAQIGTITSNRVLIVYYALLSYKSSKQLHKEQNNIKSPFFDKNC